MKIHVRRFPWVTVLLTVCAIVLGVGFNFLLQVLLPSYKNSIVTVSDMPAINQLLYVEDTEELVIFPWDQLDAGNAMTLEEYYTEYITRDFPDLPTVEKQTSIELAAQLKQLMLTSQVELQSWPDFMESLRFYGGSGRETWITLKNVPVRTTSGYDCLLDAAWGGTMGCVFFHVYKKEPEPLLDSTVKAANEYLDQIFQANWTDPYPDLSRLFTDMVSADDPLMQWLSVVHQETALDAYALASVMRASKCERIAYRDEILLVYSVDPQHRLVLFYDPLRNTVTGFSCNIF